MSTSRAAGAARRDPKSPLGDTAPARTSRRSTGTPIAEELITTLLEDVERPSAELEAACERALLDYVGCARGGAVRAPAVRARGSAEALAGLLGVLGSLLDRDDLHLPSLTHPGSVVWPTVLALGTETRATGTELVRAATLGYEVIGRVGRALGPEHRRLWHTTGTAGTLGAAAAAASMLRLDVGGTVSAVGHATSLAAGSAQALLEGTSTKVVHRGAAAAAGILAARCAAAGLAGTRLGIEGERALFAATSAVDRVGEVLTGGTHRVVEEMVNRDYASNGFAHAAIEAALELAPAVSKPVEKLEIAVPESTLPIVGSLAPQSAAEAWWSTPYAVCVTLLYGIDRLEDAELLHDAAVRRLLERAVVRPSGDECSSVTVDGSRLVKLAFRGHPDRPLTRRDLVAKGRRLDPAAGSFWNTIRLSGTSRNVARRLTVFIFDGISPAKRVTRR